VFSNDSCQVPIQLIFVSAKKLWIRFKKYGWNKWFFYFKAYLIFYVKARKNLQKLVKLYFFFSLLEHRKLSKSEHTDIEQGSMLWSKFSAIFDNFRRKNWRFSQNPMLWSQFLQKLAVVWAKNANFFH
jgi:hypothetical protein